LEVLGVGTVDVTYTGNYTFAQVSGGSDYWNPEPTYADGTIVGNRPSTADIIALYEAGSTVHTLTFSQAVLNPIMAVVSLGQPSVPVQYDFDAPFNIVTNGQGAFGNGPLTELPGDVLQGQEGNGTVQFQGSFTSISWTIPEIGEYWHGFTIGAIGVGGEPGPGPGPNPIPAPGALLLLSLGTGLVGYLRRRGSL